MLKNFALIPIFGSPLFIYVGILAFLGFLLTATIAILNKKGAHLISFAWHPRMAKLSIALAIVHAILAMSLRF